MKLGKLRPSAAAPGTKGGEPRNTQNIGLRGDAFRRPVILGLAVLGGAGLALAAYLFLLQAPAKRDALLDRIATLEAQRQAGTVNSSVVRLVERLEAAASAPGVRSAIASGDAMELRAGEGILERAFPEALSIRLIPLTEMGTADADAGTETLRNHIEIDLVRRVSNGEADQLEAYEHEGAPLASLARLVVVETGTGPGPRGALLLTLDATALRDLLPPANEALAGSYALRQRIYRNSIDRETEVMAVGSGLREYARSAAIGDTQWQIEFSPSRAMIDAAARATRPPLEVILLLVLAGMGASIFVHLGARRALARDVRDMTAGAGERSALTLRIPELVPLAQDLRRASLRGARPPAGTPAVEGQQGRGAITALSGISGPAEAELPAKIFRAYDIRGNADTDLTDETVFRIGCALATLAEELGEQTIVLGYDGRPSSPRIRDVIQNALLRSGRDVVDIGLVPTPLLYFATHRSDTQSGIMVTGSHSPADCNGLKIVLKGRTLAEGDIDRVRVMAQKGRFTRGQGRTIQQSVMSDYLDEVVRDIAIAVPLKIVVDAGNGATSHIAPDLLAELGCEVIPLNCEIDGTFPNRSPDTGDERALQGLVEAVQTHSADFGVAYDGDGDRLAVVTGSGRILRTDILMMVFARDVVARHPGADVVFDVKCSRTLGRLVSNLGGRPVLWKTGHALMKQKMMETGALLGGEFSGHIFFGERWYGFDDGMYATGRLAEILSSAGRDLDNYVADLPAAFSTPEILVPVADDRKFELMERFLAAAEFPGGKRNDLDGLRVDFEDGWGLLRASNTGPALTARFEGDSELRLQAIQDQFHEQLRKIAPDLTIPF